MLLSQRARTSLVHFKGKRCNHTKRPFQSLASINILPVPSTQFPEYNTKIAALDNLFSYPLGTDSFKIDHGNNYFSFFERLGNPVLYSVAVHTQSNRIVGAGCAVLRDIPLDFNEKKNLKKGWYLCDFKVIPEFRGNWIPFRMIMNRLHECISITPNGYGIAMNSSTNREKKEIPMMGKIIKYIKAISIDIPVTLFLFSLTKKEMDSVLLLLSNHRGRIKFRNLKGIKDLVIQSTGQPMNLLHAEWKNHSNETEFEKQENENLFTETIEGATHMFCVPETDKILLEKLISAPFSFSPSATATIISSGIQSDWKFVLTSEI